MGAYAEFVAVDVAKTARVPEGVSIRDAVASAASGALALALLHKAGLTGGETVLVEGVRGRLVVTWYGTRVSSGQVGSSPPPRNGRRWARIWWWTTGIRRG
ncbi:hypothetical protein GCM10029964_113660 [Kibdelosporangium lantanae]